MALGSLSPPETPELGDFIGEDRAMPELRAVDRDNMFGIVAVASAMF